MRRDQRRKSMLTEPYKPDAKCEGDKKHAEQNKCDVTGSIEVTGVVETRIPKDLVKQRDTERTEDNRHQTNRFRLEVITLLVLSFYAALTAIQSCQSIRSANAARSAAATAKTELELSERPWVFTDWRPVNLLLTKDQAFLETTAVMHNVGHSVALQAESFIVLEIAGQALPDKGKPSGHECDMSAKDWKDYRETNGGWIVFPGDETPISPIGDGVSLKDWPDDRPLNLIMVGCTLYGSPFEPSLHHTQKVYLVDSKNALKNSGDFRNGLGLVPPGWGVIAN